MIVLGVATRARGTARLIERRPRDRQGDGMASDRIGEDL